MTQKHRDLREKTNIGFDDKKGVIDLNDVGLAFYYQNHLENSINNNDSYKISNKDDVFSVIQDKKPSMLVELHT